MNKEYDKYLIEKGLIFHLPRWQFSQEDGNILIFLANKINPNIIFEIGCWTGHSTSFLAEIAKKNSGMVFSIDTFDGNDSILNKYIIENNFDVKNIFCKNMDLLGYIPYISIVQKDSLKACNDVNDETIDFLFIDGNHKYSIISKELNKWFPKIRKGGIICGHDCEEKIYDNKYVEIEEGYNGCHHGVIKAVFEKFPQAEILSKKIWWIQK